MPAHWRQSWRRAAGLSSFMAKNPRRNVVIAMVRMSLGRLEPYVPAGPHYPAQRVSSMVAQTNIHTAIPAPPSSSGVYIPTPKGRCGHLCQPENFIAWFTHASCHCRVVSSCCAQSGAVYLRSFSRRSILYIIYTGCTLELSPEGSSCHLGQPGAAGSYDPFLCGLLPAG